MAMLDRAVQAHGGGVDRAVEVLAVAASGDFGLVEAWALARSLRLADGPDEMHINRLSKFELDRSTELWSQ